MNNRKSGTSFIRGWEHKTASSLWKLESGERSNGSIHTTHTRNMLNNPNRRWTVPCMSCLMPIERKTIKFYCSHPSKWIHHHKRYVHYIKLTNNDTTWQELWLPCLTWCDSPLNEYQLMADVWWSQDFNLLSPSIEDSFYYVIVCGYQPSE